MKVVTTHTMQEIDRQAIEEFGIPGLDLMENAGQSCVDALISGFGPTGSATIIAGKGNNGGDGYVIARLLRQAGWNVIVHVLAERSQISGDAAINLERLPHDIVAYAPPHECQVPARYRDDITRADVIVDAMLGTGLQDDVSGIYREAIEIINDSGRPVLSVDIPSGIHGTTGRILGDAVRASVTVSFAIAKLGHVLFPGAEYSGRLIIADIGIPPHLMEAAPGYELLNAEAVSPLLSRRDRQAHKGHFGHCLVIAGSTGKTGAAALSANSAVRAGSGLVTLAVAGNLHGILETKTTEVMTVPLPDSNSGHVTSSAFPVIEHLLSDMDALALGPGLGRRPGTTALVQKIVESVSLPMVIDADGLNALADHSTSLRRKKSDQIVLTPHPGEMARLLGSSVQEVEADRIQIAREFARNFGVYLVLKGARTIIASPDGTAAINSSGNPGMASGGMGDVLTGIIASLLGQGYDAWHACCLGVFMHGYAADMVAEQKGDIGICATDVQEMLPYAFKRLRDKR
jgi:NAD(P)H-hydrate epimerase